MNIAQGARISVAERYRSHQLSSDQRAGAWSRREVRRSQRAWLRRHWRLAGIVAVWGAFTCGLVEVFVPRPVDSYVVGALVASVGWWIYSMMITTAGLTGKLAGINAEVWTAMELRRRCKKGWRLVNHVMLEHRDVDHVLLGPGGFFAVETKFRASWSNLDRELAGLATSAAAGADDAWLRMGPPHTKVQALVVLYGGGIGELRPQPFEVGGVTFCTGASLREYLAQFGTELTSLTEVMTAFRKLEANVRIRDRGETKVEGEIPRQALDSVQDVMVATVSATVALLLISISMTVSSSILWAVPTAAALIAAGIWLRRTLPTSPRAQRATTAVVTASAFLGSLVLFVWAIDVATRS